MPENNFCIWNPVEIWDWREVSYIKVFSGFLWLRWGQGGDHWRAEVLCTTGLLLFSLVWLQNCITIELVFTLSHRVCLSDDFKFQDKLYSLCFVVVKKHYNLLWVLQMPHVSFVCCSLLEMMLESSLSDLRDSQGVSLHHVPSLLRLLRLLQDFLFAEGTDNQTLWSEKVGNGLIYIVTLTKDFITHTLLFQIQKSLRQKVGGNPEWGCSHCTQIQSGFQIC